MRDFVLVADFPFDIFRRLEAGTQVQFGECFSDNLCIASMDDMHPSSRDINRQAKNALQWFDFEANHLLLGRTVHFLDVVT